MVDLIYTLVDKSNHYVYIHTTTEPSRVEHDKIIIKEFDLKLTFADNLFFIEQGSFGVMKASSKPVVLRKGLLDYRSFGREPIFIIFKSADGKNISIEITDKKPQ